MKPRIGQEVRYTEKGSGVYFQLNCCWPANNGILGNVESFSDNGNGRICTVRNRKGESEQFIWKFGGVLNDYFTWDGKPAERIVKYCECAAQDCWDENELASERCSSCGGQIIL